MVATLGQQLIDDRDYFVNVHLSPRQMDVIVACGPLVDRAHAERVAAGLGAGEEALPVRNSARLRGSLPPPMRRLLSWLGVLLGFAAARTLDAAWVMYWYAGDRAFDLPRQAALDALGLALAGLLAGRLALWLAGGSARGVGL